MPVNLASSELTPTNQGKMETSGIATGDDRFAYFVSNETVTVFDIALKRFLDEYPIEVIETLIVGDANGMIWTMSLTTKKWRKTNVKLESGRAMFMSSSIFGKMTDVISELDNSFKIYPIENWKIELTPTNQGRMEISYIASGDDRFAYFVSNKTITVFDGILKTFLEEYPIEVIGRVTKVFTTIVNRFLIITEEKKRSRTNLHVYEAKTDLDKSVTVHKLPLVASFRGFGKNIMICPIYGQGKATTFKVGTNIEIEEVIRGFVLNEKIFIFEKRKAEQYTSISLKTRTMNGRGDCDDDNGTMPRFAEDTFFANTAKAVKKHMGRLWRPVDDDYDEYDLRRHICLI
ncbi:unnamed protein product [Caenorhabditis nigoni]